jgi:hypothetical protein
VCANGDTTILADVDGPAVADFAMNLAGIAPTPVGFVP